MQIQSIESSVCNDSAEKWKQRHNKIEDMHHEYRNSLLSLGFDPEGKDLLEIITFLANELNKTKAELAELKDYTRNNFYKISYEDLSI